MDQIMSSHCFLEEKVRACICEEAEKVFTDSVAPYMSTLLEALTENISAGIQEMQHTLHMQMDFAHKHINGGKEETNKGLTPLRSIILDRSYRQLKNLKEKLEGFKQQFGMSSTQRLIDSAYLLLDSAVYSLELFLQSSDGLPSSQKFEKAKERVLKRLDYDSRVVQRRLYQEVLLGIILPTLTRRMDSNWKTELQQLEQYIFSDYSRFILVYSVYSDVLRNILSKKIETVIQDAANKKSNSVMLDTSDMVNNQYSLLQSDPSSVSPSEDEKPASVVERGGETVISGLTADVNSVPIQSSEQSTVLLSPVSVWTKEFDQSAIDSSSSSQQPVKPLEITLGTLIEAIGSNSVAPFVMQKIKGQTMDRAVYLAGEIKEKWELERGIEKKEKVEKVIHEKTKEERETEKGKEEC
ncbi:protein Niban 1-like [Labrus bergylta]|uniref:protein Niban 1-like n=1 Tax=Labrus bergylta TaxID=56723 RepID=UPI0033132C9F